VRWASVSSPHLFVEKKAHAVSRLTSKLPDTTRSGSPRRRCVFRTSRGSKVLVAASLSTTACGRHGLLCILVDVETVLAVRVRAKCSRSPFAGDAKANRTENGAQIGTGQNSAA
jgi:hypothetical protein